MNEEYKNDIRSVYKILSREELEVLHTKMRNGDESAREQLIHSCLPLVFGIAKKFRSNNRHVDMNDLIQNGNIALMRAVDDWDIAKGTITTIVTFYVRNALIDTIKDSRYTIKNRHDLTRQAADDMNKIKAVNSNDVEVIMEETGLTKKRVTILSRILKSRRIDFSLVDFRVTDGVQEPIGESTAGGCLGDICSLLDEHINDECDKDIFMSWVGHINKNNKTRLVAKEVEVSPDYVTASVRNTKKILKGVCNV